MDLNNTDARLAAFSALADRDRDLSLAVLRLANSALIDVPSWLSLRVTKAGNERPITISSSSYSSGNANARSSLRVEVDSTVHGGRNHSIVFLAEEPNAFDAFRHFHSLAPNEHAGSDRDPELEGKLSIRRLVVDGNVPIPGVLGSTAADNTDAADSERIIDHAIGILLERGCPDARRELAVLAQTANCSLLQQAHTVLNSLQQ
jgi:hypothetical protein